ALPGACVDAIAWSEGGHRIACASGLRSQAGGYIGQLDAAQLRAISYFETGWARSGRLAYLDRESTSSHIVVASPSGERVARSQSGKQAGRADPPDLHDPSTEFDFDLEKQELVLTSGAVLDSMTGQMKRRFLIMKDCTSVAVRPGGGYLGASNRGRVYCW